MCKKVLWSVKLSIKYEKVNRYWNHSLQRKVRNTKNIFLAEKFPKQNPWWDQKLLDILEQNIAHLKWFELI